MNLDNENQPSSSTFRAQGRHSGRRSLPPVNFSPHHAFPSYPSSTLHHYFPSPHYAVNYTHILPPTLQNFSSHPSNLGGTFGHGPLPSASQAHIPSLRQTPHYDNTHVLNAPSSPLVQQNNAPSHTSQCIHSISPIAFYQPQPVPPFTEPRTIPLFDVLQPDPAPTAQIPFIHNHFRPPPPAPTSIHPSSDISYVNHSLPSTKDVPILTGKHDWGPWHSAVRTLILNANLLGHIADDPLPGAIFDPVLWPPILLLFTSGPTLPNFSPSLTGGCVTVLLVMSSPLVSRPLFLEAYPLPMNAWVNAALQGPFTLPCIISMALVTTLPS